MATLRNRLYRFFIQDATFHCYANCLDFFPPHSAVLDVGIGNGTMIQDFHPVIRDKALQINGIDINRHYLRQCGDLIRKYRMEDHIHIYHEAVEQFRPPSQANYDFILFSMSFMLFDDQQAVLERVLKWLKPGGRLVFFQTIFRNHSMFLDFLKPRLIYLTTVDFGTVVYEDEFQAFLAGNHLQVVEDRMIKREWFKGEYRMIVASPEARTARPIGRPEGLPTFLHAPQSSAPAHDNARAYASQDQSGRYDQAQRDLFSQQQDAADSGYGRDQQLHHRSTRR